MRPGKLRKQSIGKDNKDGELTRAMHQVERIRSGSLFSVERVPRDPAGSLETLGIRMD